MEWSNWLALGLALLGIIATVLNRSSSWLLFGGLALLGIAVIVAIVCVLRVSTETWRETVARYQELIGGTIAFWAAGVALIGIFMTVDAEHARTKEELTAQRDLQREAQDRRRRQIASAFVGDISSLMAEVNSDLVTTNLDATIAALQGEALQDKYPVRLKFLIRLSDLYKANAAEIGQFEKPIPEWIASVYNQYRNVIGHNDVMVEHYDDYSKARRDYLTEVAKEGAYLIKHTFMLGCASREMLEAVRDDTLGKSGNESKIATIATKYQKLGVTPERVTPEPAPRAPEGKRPLLTCPSNFRPEWPGEGLTAT